MVVRWGGPIVKDKAFVFSALEGYQERAATTVQGNVPTPELRAEMIDAVPDYSLILDVFPMPNQLYTPGADAGRFIGAGSVSSDDLHWVVKPDIWLSSRAQLSATYVRARPNRDIPSVQAINNRLFEGKTDRLSLNFTFLGGPNWTSETRFGYNRNDRNRIDGLWNVMDPSREESQLGGRRLPGISALGFGVGGELNVVGKAPHRSFDQKVAITKGRHSLKFGGLFYARELGNANIENPSIRYQTKEDLLANIPVSAQFTFGRDDYNGRAKEWGLFIQDDFQFSPQLILNFGVRYDYFSNLVGFVPDGSGGPPYIFNFSRMDYGDFTVGPFRDFDDPFNKDAFNVGPRFGFAYNPDGESKTVIRGGFAMMFVPYSGEIIKNMVQVGVDEPFRSTFSRDDAIRLNLRYPSYNEDVLALVKGGTAVPAFQYLDPEGTAPYSLNFSLTVERQLSESLALETAFVGTRGVKFHALRTYNQVDRVTGLRPNPDFGQERLYDQSESTRYFSWQTSLRKRYSRNFLGNIHYTWGKAISYDRGDLGFGGSFIQDFHDIRSNRGRSDFDITHRFVSDFVYDLPALRAKSGATRAILGGWQASGVLIAQTGVPLAITQPNPISGQRPHFVGAGDPVISNRGSSLQYFDAAAFAAVPESSLTGAALRPGTLGNGAVIGPGRWNVDLMIGKSFSVTESSRIAFRTEMLNSLNHTNFTGVDTNIESVRFGQLVGTAGTRRIQFALRFEF